MAWYKQLWVRMAAWLDPILPDQRLRASARVDDGRKNRFDRLRSRKDKKAQGRQHKAPIFHGHGVGEAQVRHDTQQATSPIQSPCVRRHKIYPDSCESYAHYY
jgi:hypothetical protein